MQSEPVSRILFFGRVARGHASRLDKAVRRGPFATRPKRRPFLWAGGCPPAQCTLPAAWCETSRLAEERSSSLAAYTGLLAVGFALPRLSPDARCALTAPFHPYQGVVSSQLSVFSFRSGFDMTPEIANVKLTTDNRPLPGGIFSVALSLASLPVAVSHHRALSSSDFPPGARGPGRSPGPLCNRIVSQAPAAPPDGSLPRQTPLS